jgi:hypothetical protein
MGVGDCRVQSLRSTLHRFYEAVTFDKGRRSHPIKRRHLDLGRPSWHETRYAKTVLGKLQLTTIRARSISGL